VTSSWFIIPQLYESLFHKPKTDIISGFSRGLNKISALLWCYAA